MPKPEQVKSHRPLSLRDVVVGALAFAAGAGAGWVAKPQISSQPQEKYSIHIEATKLPSGLYRIDNVILVRVDGGNRGLVVRDVYNDGIQIRSNAPARLTPQEVERVKGWKNLTLHLDPQYLQDAGVELDIQEFPGGKSYSVK